MALFITESLSLQGSRGKKLKDREKMTPYIV